MIYLITALGKPPVELRGYAIRTEIQYVLIPPSVPGYFQFYVSDPTIPGVQIGGSYFLANFYSFAVPTFRMYPRFGGDPYCGLEITTFNQFGQASRYFGQAGRAYNCQSLTMTPNSIRVPQCQAIVTASSSGAGGVVSSKPGQPCPVWTSRNEDCLDTEIRCDDPSDPRSFCCVSCDLLNSKIRTLI